MFYNWRFLEFVIGYRQIVMVLITKSLTKCEMVMKFKIRIEKATIFLLYVFLLFKFKYKWYSTFCNTIAKVKELHTKIMKSIPSNGIWASFQTLSLQEGHSDVSSSQLLDGRLVFQKVLDVLPWKVVEVCAVPLGRSHWRFPNVSSSNIHSCKCLEHFT